MRCECIHIKNNHQTVETQTRLILPEVSSLLFGLKELFLSLSRSCFNKVSCSVISSSDWGGVYVRPLTSNWPLSCVWWFSPFSDCHQVFSLFGANVVTTFSIRWPLVWSERSSYGTVESHMKHFFSSWLRRDREVSEWLTYCNCFRAPLETFTLFTMWLRERPSRQFLLTFESFLYFQLYLTTWSQSFGPIVHLILFLTSVLFCQ